MRTSGSNIRGFSPAAAALEAGRVKIVHLLPALTKGGGERVAVDLANHAAAAGHEVTVVAGFETDPSLLACQLRTDVALRFVSSASRSTLRRYAEGAAWVRREWDWLTGRDVIHCHLTYGAVLGSLIRLLRRARGGARPAVVETYHGVGMPIPARARALHAFFAGQRDGLALMAEDPWWEAFRRARPALESRIILNGVSAPRQVNEDERRAYAATIGLPENAGPVAGTIGAMRPERRTAELIRLFADVGRAVGPDCHFIVGGDGPEMQHARAEVAATGAADRIHLPGLVVEPALPLSLMDLYVTLNVGAVTGVAAIEAALAGVPVVALQLLQDYRAREEDWIWSSPDVREVARRAAALLGDPASRGALARRQQAHANAHHSVAVMAQAYHSLYEAAIAAARRGAPS